MRERPEVRIALVMVSAVVVQIGVLALIRPGGVAPDLLLAVAVAGGLVTDDRRGALTGFVAGVALDLVMAGRPVGLAALTFTVVGFAAGRYAVAARRTTPWALAAVAAGLAVLAAGLYGVAAQLFGQGDVFGGRFVVVALVSALWTAMLVLPTRAVMAWAWMEPVDARSGVK